MNTWQAGEVESNRIRLHYVRTGGAKPSIVLAHGVTDDGLCWTPVAEALAPDYDIVMVDARGHGLSDAPEQGYDPATQAVDHRGVIEALELHRPILIGHSMGALTMLVLAAANPDLPGAILLEDPPPVWSRSGPESPGEVERRGAMRAWLTSVRQQSREALIAAQRAAAPAWSEAELEPWAESKLRVSPHVAQVFDSGFSRTVDWPKRLPHIICPALLITAEPERGAIVTPESAAVLRDRVPQLQVVRIPDAGHNIRRDQFDRFMNVIRSFLATA
jgi:N-formylmaleamate deformylase